MLERANRPRERALRPPFCICEDSSEGHALTVGEKQARGRFCKFQWPSASSYGESLKKKPRPKFGRNLSPLPSFQLLGYLWFKQRYFCQGTASLCFFEARALLCLEVFIWFLLPSSLIHIFFWLLFSNKPFTLYNIFLLPDIICLLLIGCSLPSNFRSHIMPEKQPLFWRNKHHG